MIKISIHTNLVLFIFINKKTTNECGLSFYSECKPIIFRFYCRQSYKV